MASNHRRVAITIYTIMDATGVPYVGRPNPYALKDLVLQFVHDCNCEYYNLEWEDLGPEFFDDEEGVKNDDSK